MLVAGAAAMAAGAPIAAGVDLPWLALQDLLGEPLPPGAGDFAEVALVRYLDERVIEPAALAAMERAAS